MIYQNVFNLFIHMLMTTSIFFKFLLLAKKYIYTTKIFLFFLKNLNFKKYFTYSFRNTEIGKVSFCHSALQYQQYQTESRAKNSIQVSLVEPSSATSQGVYNQEAETRNLLEPKPRYCISENGKPKQCLITSQNIHPSS